MSNDPRPQPWQLPFCKLRDGHGGSPCATRKVQAGTLLLCPVCDEQALEAIRTNKAPA